uniref:PAZ domain-containing protein n=1 Tax=Meloidogyne incognita TaxID=6306 RepID=A0A914NNG7_MELIC
MNSHSSSNKVIDECTRILGCSAKSLRDHLNHPDNRVLIFKEILGRKVQTTYEDQNGFKKTFRIDGLTRHGGNSLVAYGRLPFPYNVSVAAHFYARHRIRLRYPYLQCVVERFPFGGEDRYYPMELLEFVPEQEDRLANKWVNKLSSDLSNKLTISEEPKSPVIILKKDQDLEIPNFELW